jgi:two-component system response regulator AtoC
MPKMEGFALLDQALSNAPELCFLVMSAYGSKEQALEAVRRGAYDFLQKPFKPEELVLLLQKADERLRLVRENRRLRGNVRPSAALDRLVGTSPKMESLKRQIAKVAPVSSTVLILGESGTGKELVARALHDLSPRSGQPFITINCGAIPAGLIESELFGHAKGAFTDARSAKRGLFSEADGGTIFLDEIGELPPSAQVKLLRVLQEGEVRPVGEARTEKIDVRVVAATLRDLSRLIERQEFREDLYFRLNVVPLNVPPLRERGPDVLALALTFLAKYSKAFNREPALSMVSPEAEALLSGYAWPGNVRELENAMERAVLLAEGSTLLPEHLPERIWSPPSNAAQPVAKTSTPSSDLSLKRAMRELEERFIRAALRRTHGNRTRAAELLELSQRALLYKLKDYGIDADLEGETPEESI